jgi:hypothetical protein
MTALFPDLAVTVHRHRRVCVLDPALAMSPIGLLLLKHLSTALEVWIARELWHILDNTHFYYRHPEVLMAHTGRELPHHSSAEQSSVIDALRAWERIRLENDLTRQHCYWIGDGPIESLLPEGLDPGIVLRFEQLSASLDRRIGEARALPAALRDAVALAVALPAAFILSFRSIDSKQSIVPGICLALESWGIPCSAVAADDPWRQIESDDLCQLLSRAGLAKWIWAGFTLIVIHIAAPGAFSLESTPASDTRFPADDGLEYEFMATGYPADYWNRAGAYWYDL